MTSSFRPVRQAARPAADNGEGGIYAVSCASTAFCAAVDDQGNVLNSSTPTGSASAWHIVPVYSGIGSAGGLLVQLHAPDRSLFGVERRRIRTHGRLLPLEVTVRSGGLGRLGALGRDARVVFARDAGRDEP